MRKHDAFERGKRDALRNKAPLFRHTKNGFQTDIDDPMADDWSQEDRRNYLEGYNEG